MTDRAVDPNARRPMRNRVTPTGDIVAAPLRGAWTGNRGNLHRGTDIVRFHGGSLWITCALQFRDYRMTQWAPGHYTVLFFHDEAVALAAGHRPCALCRRADYQAFREAWAAGRGEGTVPSAAEVDRQLHGERIVRGTHTRRTHAMPWSGLPDGAFVSLDDGPALVLGDGVVAWTIDGYGPARTRPGTGTADVITPPSTIAALGAGYRPQIDAAARSVLQRDRARGVTGRHHHRLTAEPLPGGFRDRRAHDPVLSRERLRADEQLCRDRQRPA